MVHRLIKTDSEHEAALARIDKLMDAKAGTPRGDELELLAMLVERYEQENFPIARPSPVEAIRFRMEQGGIRQQDLVPFIGSRSKVSEVLGGKRSLSLRMIRSLHEGLGIPAEVLLQVPAGQPPKAASCSIRKRRSSPARAGLRRLGMAHSMR